MKAIRFLYGGSSPPPTTQSGQTNTVTQPWASAQPYLTQGMNLAANLYAQGPQQYTPWSQVANFDPLQVNAMSGIENYANSQGTQNFMNTAQNAVTNSLSGNPNQTQQVANQGANQLAGYVSNNNLNDPNYALNQMAYGNNTNPYLQQNVGNALQQLSNNFVTQTLPGMRQQAMANGSYGSSRNEMAEGQAAGALSNQMNQTSQGMYQNAWNTNNANQMSALGQLGQNQANQASLNSQLFNQGTTQNLNAQSIGLNGFSNALNGPLSMLGALGSVGANQQTQNQNQINDATNRWNFDQNAPYNNLVNYAGLINGNAALGGSGSQSAYNQQYAAPVNLWSNAMGGLLSATGMAGQLMGSGGGNAFSQGGGFQGNGALSSYGTGANSTSLLGQGFGE